MPGTVQPKTAIARDMKPASTLHDDTLPGDSLLQAEGIKLEQIPPRCESLPSLGVGLKFSHF